MGLGDKLKGLTKQAQEAVADRKDQIHEAVDVASVAADRKTRGKHSAKIAKFGQKAGDAVDRFASRGEDASTSGEPHVGDEPHDGDKPHEGSPPAGH